jgi:pimeloyl-ACP methyl ester carboxylesterase
MRKTQHYLLVGLLALFQLPLFAQSLPIASPLPCNPGQPKVDEAGYVRLGGIEQWVIIRGDNCANPVILFVHGGPGNPNTPYAHGPYRPWEKQFTLVEWDQRGAGRTFARNPVKPGEDGPALTVERIAQDGTELASMVLSHLKANKAILMGGSWGSVVAVHMAKARPGLFAAYVGTGQLVSQAENLPASYGKLMAMARAAGDAKVVTLLEGIGAPPWTNPRAMGAMRRISRPYEAKTAMPAPGAWLALAPAYATPQAQADYEQGEDYSWLQFVGIKGNGMLSTIDLTKLGPEFKLPVFLVQGEDDLVTLPEVAKRYFDAISAPQKEYFLLPRTGHDPNPLMIEAQWRIVTTRVPR